MAYYVNKRSVISKKFSFKESTCVEKGKWIMCGNGNKLRKVRSRKSRFNVSNYRNTMRRSNKSRCAWAFDTAGVPTTSLTSSKAVTTATKSGKSNEGPAEEMNALIEWQKKAYLNCIEVRDSLF